MIAILGILASIISLAISGFVKSSRQRVCEINRIQIEKLYSAELALEGAAHSESLFNEFIEQYGDCCPTGGLYSFVDNSVVCSIHAEESVGESEGEEVPYLYEFGLLIDKGSRAKIFNRSIVIIEDA